MPIRKKKISELTLADTLKGLYTIGYKVVDGVSVSVKVGLEYIQTAYENVVAATKKALDAATAADTSREGIEKNEKERQLNEAVRVNVEAARKTAETGRVNAESSRVTVETARANAEGIRLTKETERQNKEAARITEEGKRLTEFGTLKKNSELATGAANAGAANAEQAAIGANTSADNADEKAALALSAADNANDTASHPTYIGTDHYVYKWNKTTKAYDKTDIYTKGDAFSVKEVYTSVELMDADVDNIDVAVGDFVLVNTADVENPDNAKLYVKVQNEDASYSYEFLVDMSGAIGFTGKTPQLFIGAITTSEAGTEAQATVSEDGTDADGNPKYKLNFSIPRGNPGAPFQVKGTYTTVEALKVAIPDGSGVEGFIAVGDKIPYDYYAWVNGDWMDHGKIAGDGGKMVLIPSAVINLANTSTSNEVLNAFGSKDKFIEIVTKIKNGAPAAINPGSVSMALPVCGGVINEEQSRYALNFLFVDPTAGIGNFSFSFVLTGDVVDVDKFAAPIGYADLANTLTKFQLVSDPATGGTDVPASAEAVKVVNSKVEARVPFGRLSPPSSPIGWYRIAIGDAYPVAKTALITIGSIYNSNPPQSFCLLTSHANGYNDVKVLSKYKTNSDSFIIDKVRFLSKSSWSSETYIDIHYGHSQPNEILITATNVIGNTFYAIPQKVSDTPPEGFTSIEFEI